MVQLFLDAYLDSEEDDNILLELVVNVISSSIKAYGERSNVRYWRMF